MVWSDVKVKAEEEAPGRCLVLATEDSEVPTDANEKMGRVCFSTWWHFADLENVWFS